MRILRGIAAGAAMLAAAGCALRSGAGAPAQDAEPAIETRIDRATRTLVFASAEARLADGRKAAAASGVYRVEQA